MTDAEEKRRPSGPTEQYSVFFLCLVTSALTRRGGYGEGDLGRALRDARALHGVVVRASDGAATSDGKTWRRGQSGQ